MRLYDYCLGQDVRFELAVNIIVGLQRVNPTDSYVFTNVRSLCIRALV